MRHATSFVFHNVDGDGVPTQAGDVIALVECPKNMDRIKRLHPHHSLIRMPLNYRVAALVNKDVVKVNRAYARLVHESSSKPPTPRRTILILECEIDGVEVDIYIGHAVNSAWAPLWKPTTYRKARRKLWLEWYRKMNALVTESDRKDRLAVALVDGNRSRGKWTFARMDKKWVHGPDAIFVSRHHKSFPLVLNQKVGPKTGRGRVTHHSLRFSLSIHKP